MLDTKTTESQYVLGDFSESQENIMTTAQTTVEMDVTTSSRRSIKKSLRITSDHLRELFDTQSVGRRPLKDEEREEVCEIFLKPLYAYLKIEKINNIKKNVDDLSGDIKSLLIRDELFTEVVSQVLYEIKNLPALSGLKPWIRIFISKDMEIPDWEEVVVSVGVKNKGFDETMEIWEEIEKKVEEVINKIKATIPSRETYEDKSHITEIDEKLSVEVKTI
jgi:hypothetical protein